MDSTATVLNREDFPNNVSYLQYLYQHPAIPYNSFDEFLQYVDYMAANAVAVNKAKLITRINGGKKDSQLFTLSFDQKLDAKGVVAHMDLIMENIIQANYAWMHEAAYCYEFYSGRENKWNPHIHIAVTSTGLAPSKMVANLKLKLKKCKMEELCYNINCTQAKGAGSRHADYVRGLKTDSKSPNIEKDNKVRMDLKLEPFYIV